MAPPYTRTPLQHCRTCNHRVWRLLHHHLRHGAVTAVLAARRVVAALLLHLPSSLHCPPKKKGAAHTL